MKNIICAIFVGLFPYVPVVLLASGADIEWALGGIAGIFVVALASCVLNFVFALKDRVSAEKLALTAMLVKLIHIPAYILFFMIGAGGIMLIQFLAITILIFLFDCITIGFSGTFELAAILRAKNEGKLKLSEALVGAVCSYVFCIDVVCAVVVYICLKKSNKVMCNEE